MMMQYGSWKEIVCNGRSELRLLLAGSGLAEEADCASEELITKTRANFKVCAKHILATMVST